MPNALTLDSISPKLLTVARERHQALYGLFSSPSAGYSNLRADARKPSQRRSRMGVHDMKVICEGFCARCEGVLYFWPQI